MTTHSNLSPSKRVRWANCPGSIREEAKYPPKPSGPAAVDGTHTHSLLEKCINDCNDASKYIGLTLKDHDGEFTVELTVPSVCSWHSTTSRSAWLT